MARNDYTSGNDRWRLILDAYVSNYSDSGNWTDLTFWVGVTGNGYSSPQGNLSWSASIAGASNSGSFYYTATSAEVGLWSGTVRIYHDASGRASANISGSSSGDVGPSTTVYWASGSFGIPGIPDFSRPPLAPGAPSLTRSSDGGTIYITSQPSDGRGLAVTDYNWVYSTDGSNWSAVQGMGTGRYATFGCTSTQGYYIMTRAYSSEGWGAWSPATYIQGVPGLPASISLVRTGRNVAVTCGAASGSVSGYYVEYSTDNATWGNAQAMSGQSYTYTNLTPGLTYYFRVWAVNAIGYSAKLAATGLYVPAGGYAWNGSSEVSAQAYMWNGSAEVPILTAVFWDGTKEVPLS